jgi:hypothetical protein
MLELIVSPASLSDPHGMLVVGAGLIGLALVVRKLIPALRQTVDVKANRTPDGDQVLTVVARPSARIDPVSNI